MICFSIPGEPVQFARAGRNGKRSFTPATQANFMAAVQMHASRAMDGLEPLQGPVRLEARFTYARPKSHKKAQLASAWKTSTPDADNLIKIIKDSCNTIVWRDDAQVADMMVQKVYGPVVGAVVVVTPLDAAEAGR